MLISITYILFSGMLLGALCKKVRFPSLFGMIIAGILIGPHVFNLIDDSILNISTEIRKIALIIILIRAGLKLSTSDLKKVGRPAILMCFLPATCEVIGMILIAPAILGISRLDAAILGAVVAAVSPAVIVPRMIKLIDEGYGSKNAIPQMILAGASVDDVFVIVLFTTFTSLAQGNGVSVMSFVNIPISIVVGIGIGFIAGLILYKLFMVTNTQITIKALIVLGTCFILTYLEDMFGTIIPFASLIGVMSVGLMLRIKDEVQAKSLSQIFDKMWIPAEVFLFVLVGASVQIESLKDAGLKSIVLIILVLIFRMVGVYICLIKTKLNNREKIFSMLAYTPKATVQAAIGGLPLAMGLSCGNIVLTVSVIAIMLTAPLGAFAIDLTYKKFLR